MAPRSNDQPQRISLPRFGRNKVAVSTKAHAADAARRDTGTSYQATGHVDPGSASYAEMGSSFKSPLPEIVPELNSAYSQNLAYTSMYRSDVSVRVGLRCGEAPVLGGDFTVEGYDADPQSQAIREFVEWQLFSASKPWGQTLQQIIKMMRDGYSLFEPVWELREWAPTKSSKGANRRQYTSLKRLAVRPTTTITDLKYDDYGELLQVTQQAIGAEFKSREEIIPANKLLVFSFDQQGGDIRGESILRPAYPHWYMKQKLYAIDSIAKERHGIGIPDIELQPGFTPADLTAANILGKNLRTNEYAYIVRTTNMKVGFAEIKTQPANALESAVHHDMMIMKNILVQFLNTDVGSSRNTSSTSLDMMLKAMRYIANYICGIVNYYLIPPMVGYNFNVDTFPKLCVRNIGETKDLQMWSAAMANLINAEAIYVDDETEQFIRRVVDMPKRITPRPVPLLGPHDTRQQTLLQGVVPGTDDKTPAQKAGNGKTGTTGDTKAVQSGNIGTSPSSG